MGQNYVTTLALSLLTESSSFLHVDMTAIKAWMSLNSARPDNVPRSSPRISKKMIFHFFSFAIDPILFKQAGNNYMHIFRMQGSPLEFHFRGQKFPLALI